MTAFPHRPFLHEPELTPEPPRKGGDEFTKAGKWTLIVISALIALSVVVDWVRS